MLAPPAQCAHKSRFAGLLPVNSKIEKGSEQIVVCKEPLSVRLTKFRSDVDDDDLLGSAHHLRGLRDRVLHLVRVGRNGLHLEHLAELGDLLREPARDDLLRVCLAGLGLQRVVEFDERGIHFGAGELRKLLDQVGLALVARPRKLVREQVVAGHEVQDVVHPVDVSRGDEPTRGDAQYVAEMELFRLHGNLQFWFGNVLVLSHYSSKWESVSILTYR